MSRLVAALGVFLLGAMPALAGVSVTIQTAPDPPTGTVLATPLGDSADLEGGSSPTGTITFRQYPPSDPTCGGVPIFTDTVTVSGNGVYSVSGSAPASSITETGMYHWTASYSGDGNNDPAASPCFAEEVLISQPVLTIVKTPDGAVISAGDTATFTVTVTNNGPGAATDVAISDPLPAGDGVTWTTGTVGCAATGPVGSQTLNCAVGSLTAGDSFTAVVSAVTSVEHCALMANLATASASNADSVTDAGDISCQTPVLTMAKTPDGTTITAGDTATFTIVVTNNGPGAAKGVTVSDSLPAGGGVNWTTASAGCSVTGAINSQTLHCSFGDLSEIASMTAVVSAVTGASACETMNNLATASATNAAQVSDPGSITCNSSPLASPTLRNQPNPANGKKKEPRLGDLADLEGGSSPTGTITFTLYPPSDPACTGAAIFANVVTVSGNAVYSTSATAPPRLIMEAGVYHWKAGYSGDANNNPATTLCADGPVLITNDSNPAVAGSLTSTTNLSGPSDTQTVYTTPAAGDFALTALCVSPTVTGGILLEASGFGTIAHLGVDGKGCRTFSEGLLLPANSTITCSTTAEASPGTYFCTISGLQN